MVTEDPLGDLIADHRFQDHRSSVGDMCVCGWTSHHVPWGYHVADLVRAHGWMDGES